MAKTFSDFTGRSLYSYWGYVTPSGKVMTGDHGNHDDLARKLKAGRDGLQAIKAGFIPFGVERQTGTTAVACLLDDTGCVARLLSFLEQDPHILGDIRADMCATGHGVKSIFADDVPTFRRKLNEL